MTNLALNMHNVGIRYPHFELSNVHLQLEKGSILGLIGPNGAGKSTCIRMMMGLLLPETGSVEVLGYNMATDAKTAKWKIGYSSEDLRLYKSKTMGWHMEFVSSIFQDWDHDYAKRLMKIFDLNPDFKIKGLSHGQRVKASLLLILARRPDLLILDEPTTGLDPVARRETLNEMMEILVDEHRSIIFSSHNTSDVEQLSDQITFIDKGRVVNSNDKETFLEQWRRIRVTLKEGQSLPHLTHVSEQQKSGRSAILTTNKFSNALLQEWKTELEQIDAIEMMTLEEIFLAEVAMSRKGELS